MKQISHYIQGKYQKWKTERTAPVFNPATGEQSAELLLATREQTEEAILSAKNAFLLWAAVPPLRRARILFTFNQLLLENSDKIVEAISKEHGKVWEDAEGELIRGREVIEFACGIPQLLKGEYSLNVGSSVDAYTLMQPLGVCVGITPFNFPAMVPMWMFPIALACGNTFVLKPSEKTPSAPLLLAELLTKAGLPDGVFNVVNGDKEAVDALLDSPDVQAVSFVGSTLVAEYIYGKGSAKHKRVQALGGAKNHMVVMPDADIETAIPALLGAAYGSAGERCMAISVVVLVGDIADDFVNRTQQAIAKLRVGAGYVKGSHNDFGPVITAEHKSKVLSFIKSGLEQGAQLVVDGRNVDVKDHNGYFIGACLFDRVTTDMKIYKEEIFGPVLSVVRVPTAADALALVNNHKFGNGVAIFTSNGAVAREFSTHCNIGMVGINVPIPVPAAHHSFGGWKQSIFSANDIYGPEGVRFYTHNKKVTVRWEGNVSQSNPFHMPTLA